MESVYENLKNHFRRKLSCFRLELLGFDLLKGVAVVLFTFLLFCCLFCFPQPPLLPGGEQLFGGRHED